MPWQCSICAAFAADSMTQILNHIGRCDRNDANFHCVCGINGCAKTFKKYYTWRKHIQKNTNIGNDDLQGQFDDQPAVGKMDRDMIHFDTAVNDLAEVTRSSALYLLKLQEECC